MTLKSLNAQPNDSQREDFVTKIGVAVNIGPGFIGDVNGGLGPVAIRIAGILL
jgi:hypothetical protein